MAYRAGLLDTDETLEASRNDQRQEDVTSHTALIWEKNLSVTKRCIDFLKSGKPE